MKKICIVGCNGMLGSSVSRLFNMDAGYDITCIDYPDIDITDESSIVRSLSGRKIDYLINCSAITDTTYCGTDEGMIKSYDVNVCGSAALARYCVGKDIHFIHISTDSVHSEYQKCQDIMFPVNVYACHKLIAEMYIKTVFAGKESRYSILRCSWIYGVTQKKKNYVEKFIGFCEKSKDGNVYVVDDCYGRPTSTEYVAHFIRGCIETGQHGIIDSQTNQAPITRYEFSRMIAQQLKLTDVNVIPVQSSYFKGIINQNKSVPDKMTDESGKYSSIMKFIDHNSDYQYWLNKYFADKNIFV